MTQQFINGAVQPLLGAAYLFNIFFDPKSPASSLTIARDKLKSRMENEGVMESWTELLFQTIEGQLGADTPIPACTPHGDHPIMIFAWARWFVKEYLPERNLL